jgi:NAD(P)-dependent dehydrogenase (short-subunit alcohol dehydrogenase family)
MRVMDMFDLTGKTAVVTGGSIGLGAQMATSLAEAGANLVVAARKVDRCVELCKKLEGLGVRALAVACDASKADECQNLVDVTVKEFGTLDILVNNAGITWGADSMNFPMDKWHQILNLNLTGVFQLSAMAAKVMKEQGGGKIINISSLSSYGGTKPEDMDAVAYNTSKGAINTLTKDLAVKWASYGIYVNAIAPGFFPTHMSKSLLGKNADIYLSQVPFGRFGGEEDLKGAVVFLSSAASNFITGQIINVDGGQMAMV